MAGLSGSNDVLGKARGEIHGSVWSDELEELPLKLRLKALLASKRPSAASDARLGVLGGGNNSETMPYEDILVRKEDHPPDSQGVLSFHSACFTTEGKSRRLLPEQSHADIPLEGIISEVPNCKKSVDSDAIGPCLQNVLSIKDVVNADTIGVEEDTVNVGTSLQSILPKIPAKIEVESCNNMVSSLGDGIFGPAGSDLQAVKFGNGITNDLVNELDHVILKERRRMLLSRKLLGTVKPTLEGDSEKLSSCVIEDYAGLIAGESHSNNGGSSVAGNQVFCISEGSAYDHCRTSRFGSLNSVTAGRIHQCSPSVCVCQGIESVRSRNHMVIQESDRMCSSESSFTQVKSCGLQDFIPAASDSTLTSALSTSVKVKNEPLDNSDLPGTDMKNVGDFYGVDKNAVGDLSVPAFPDGIFSSPLLSSIKVKDDLLDDNDLHSPDKNAVDNFLFGDSLIVKSELQIPDETLGDQVDHIPLQDRIKSLMSGEVPNLNTSSNLECLPNIVPSVLGSNPVVPESAKPVRIRRSQKRKKTSTDSVETALEEDAPGLLQALVDKGVLVDEIKLYGETVNDDALDDSFSEDSFAELESIISKIFSQRHSLLKFTPIRSAKFAKASYCLACLISLVEQTRYLQFRKWPVEWGWCRDLQSFIFVFKRHNRIVLERPEYGYATYFFELVDSLPIGWQIMRLVTAMKLTHCSRVTLIENKALTVGEDLTEGEAKVLMEYGWVPNSGLATMLNYCDRVVHDWKKENSSEWRSKIGKLLMNGYNGGTVVSTDIPKKVMEISGSVSPQIKMEL
ncbi:uncharacterized protein LOC131160508 isoform X2 [Malania oleifera]|uniref:uncharacterized protein LOC131160508 isoform X2 n=1 Tax=Malania oleifera TaxID=397392 RepID=UPI0025ADFAAC|nr:uncharacterized protein LOC131160508 isoform X2 [Malania oleifera]